MFCQRGSNFDNVLFLSFLGDEGREDPNTTTVKCHLNDVSLTGKICPNIEFWLGSFVILQGIRTSIAKKI